MRLTRLTTCRSFDDESNEPIATKLFLTLDLRRVRFGPDVRQFDALAFEAEDKVTDFRLYEAVPLELIILALG